jgi:phosphoenolpyruvate phosphomutase
MKKEKIAYVSLAVDILHSGHINIITKAKKYGRVVVGLLSDQAIAEYKDLPILNYEERYKIAKSIKNVDSIVKQNSWDFSEVINQLKPDFLVHGDDWTKGVQKNMRLKVIKLLKKNNGKLIEVPYSKNISSSKIRSKLRNYLSPNSRVSILRRLIDNQKIVRILEAHSPLSGLIAENMKITKRGKMEQFHGMWSSSLTDSSVKGKPDNQSLDLSARFNSIGDLFDVTTKPLIFDADNGGRIEHLPFSIRTLERLGVSAIMMEDKVGLKKNSLFSDQSGAKQDSIKNFSQKIKSIVKARYSKDFLIGARIESFILGKGIKDALKRAESYSEAGADLILIHSKSDNPKEIFSFSKIFRKSKNFKPLVSVPSTYSKTYEKDLIKNGFKIVIYANQMLRASYPAMENVAKTILSSQRAYELENKISTVKEVINLIK